MRNNSGGLIGGAGGLTRRRFLLGTAQLGGVALGASLLGACGDGGAAAGSDTFDLGWIVPTTGSLASTLQPLLINGQIAVDEINAAGGILGRQIRPLKQDDEGAPAKEPTVIRALQDQRIQYAFGPTGSSQALASLASSTPARMIQCAWGNNADLADGNRYPYHYLAAYTTRQQAESVVGFAVDKLGTRKVAVIAEATAFGQQAAQFTADELTKRGLSPTTSQVYPGDATSLATYVQTCRDSGADVLVAWVANIKAGALMFDAMRNLKWAPPVVGHNALFIEAIFDLVPAESLQNVYGTYYKTMTYTDSEQPAQRYQDYAKKVMAYPEARGPAPNVAAAPYYDFLHILKQVVEDVGTFDPAKVKPALDAVKDYDGILGKISFSAQDHGGFATDEVALGVVASGKDPRSQGVFRLRAPGT
ncbi:MAG: hypothetical protein ABS81_02425 [Pseudonocardia sp. SCN 72-86]|nr:MAG: hypothetical protein ABS81_02425 [Pseudonocardia sp. SCN 72-86]